MFEQIIASDAGNKKFWYPIYGRRIFTNVNVIYHHTESMVISSELTYAACQVVLMADFDTVTWWD